MTPPAANFVEILRRRAGATGARTAFTFLVDGEATAVSLTYADLDRKAREIATGLQANAAAGERAILLYASGLEFIAAFFGCLYAGTVAVPVYPPDPARLQRTLPRLLSIVADAQASIVLTTSSLLGMAEALFDQAPLLAGKKWMATDRCGNSADAWKPVHVATDEVAFLQYTSGSTGAPHGVMMTHANVVANSAHVSRAFHHAPDLVSVNWLPLYHDMGLVGTILVPVFAGSRSVLMSPSDFLAKPVRWLKAIAKYGAHAAGGPNFAYDLCARKVTPDEVATLDLRSWKVAFNGAETVRASTIDRFSETFAPSGFRRSAFLPCYGMAEATLFVTGAEYSREPTVRTVDRRALGEGGVCFVEQGPNAVALVSSGGAVEDEVVVVDPGTMRECGGGTVGEIWLRGGNVAKGYWNRPEKTEHVFGARVPSRRGTFLRSGDLGFTSGGELFIVGRSKDLIIIRGVNHYPQDIEATVEASWPSLRRGCTAAFSVDVDGGEQLVVVAEVERRYLADRRARATNPAGDERRQADRRGPPSEAVEAGDAAEPQQFDCDAIFEAVRLAVVEQHEVSVYAVLLLTPGTIPKTSSGKIQRHACRAGFLEGSLHEIARSMAPKAKALPRESRVEARDVRAATGAERKALLTTYLLQALAAFLDTTPQAIDVHRPVNTLGIDSLAAVELNYQIEQELGAAIPFSTLLRPETVTSLADLVSAKMDEGTDAPPIDAAPRNRPLPLSYSQQSFWDWEQKHPGTSTWHLPRTCRLVGNLDVAVLQRAWKEMVRRNEILRTRFVTVDGRSAMVVDPDGCDIALSELRTNESPEPQIAALAAAEALTPFDLARQPVRARLLPVGAREHVLFLTIHHIVVDGVGLRQLFEDLVTVYEAFLRAEPSPLEELPFQFADYAAWQRKWYCPEALTPRAEYWRRQLAGATPTLLPADAMPQPVQDRRPYHSALFVNAERTAALEAIGRRDGATLFMTLLAALATLLRRYRPQNEIVLSSATANRAARPELRRLVANFAESLVFRFDVSGDLTFRRLLERVHRTTLDAYENGDLAARFILDSDSPFDHPLLGVRLNLEPPVEARTTPTLEIRPGATGFEMMDHVADPYPLEIGFIPSIRGLEGWLTSSGNTFKATTLDQIARDYLALLESIVANPDQPL